MRTGKLGYVLGALMLSVALLGMVPAGPALGAEPDLKIEHVGFWAPDNDRGIQFRVTNVGTGPASAGKAHIQTLSPPPANIAEPAYPALAPNQSFTFRYELATPCDGHVVRAGVSATADGEKEYDNNEFRGEVCPKKPVDPADLGIVLRPRPDIDVFIPEHMRSGEHTLELRASEMDWRFESYTSDPEDCPILGRGNFPENPVGWTQTEYAARGPFGIEFDECNLAAVAETAVNFNYGILDEVPDKRVTWAVLEFDEHRVEWTDGEGRNRPGPGCVARVGIVTTERSHDPAHQKFFNYQPLLNIAPRTAMSWEVLEPTADHVHNRRPRHGFILQGTHNLDQLEGEDNSKCLSRLENPRLIVTYVVP